MTGAEIAMAVAMVATTAASVGMQAHAASQQKKAQKAQIRYQQETDQRALEIRTETRRRQLAALMSSQRALFAGSGLDPTAGSALAVGAGTAYEAASDIATDQEMTGRGLGGLEYRRDVLSYEQSLIPYQAGASFAAQAASIGLAYSQTGKPAETATQRRERIIGGATPVPRPSRA